MTAPPGDRGQLDFLQHVQRIFDEGEFVATYKFALLIALVELAIERGDDTGAPAVDEYASRRKPGFRSTNSLLKFERFS
jgi:hypothetical protein